MICTHDRCFFFLTADASLRLSPLGDTATTQVVYSHANIFLGPTAPRSPSSSRETSEGLLRARMPPLGYHLARRVIVPSENSFSGGDLENNIGGATSPTRTLSDTRSI